MYIKYVVCKSVTVKILVSCSQETDYLNQENINLCLLFFWSYAILSI